LVFFVIHLGETHCNCSSQVPHAASFQVIVQRTLAAKNLSHAKGGSIMAGYLKLLPIFLMIFPGMISRALFPDEVACVDPDICREVCDNPAGCSNIAYPKLVLELLPFGVRGLLMAVMLSAIMSSLTSIFNSSSTIFTMDLWRRARPRATQRELLIVGRIFIVILCGISIAWIPLVRSSQGGQLFNYIQSIQGYLGTPIGALFVLGVFWKRMNEQGAFWGILIGHMCGVIRMGLDFAYPAPECGDPETRPPVLLRVHYTYFGSIMIVVTSAAIIIISLATRPQEEEELVGVTWWTRMKPEDKGDHSTDSETEQAKDNRPASNGVQIAEPDDGNERTVGCAKRACNFVCGMPDDSSGATSPSTDETQTRRFLKENKRWSTVLNINAAIGLIVTAFLYGFYR
ncbi:sodium/glucose cotransporter 4-like, partial [Mizuhopecten yessoensis]|uniref:sodium/glucose cotransporter 4-like n=1 Tax=Mizuhopecten yessoensis TaxID=6573 RepID=UPI000B45E6A0